MTSGGLKNLHSSEFAQAIQESAHPAGSFAKVYRGVYGQTKVAVKIVHSMCENLQADEHPSEAHLMQAASHPNLLKLLHWKLTDTAKHQQRLWLVTEFCDKGCVAVNIASRRTAEISSHLS